MRPALGNIPWYLETLTQHSTRQLVARVWNRGGWRWHTRPLAANDGCAERVSDDVSAELCRLASAATTAAAELASRPDLLHPWHEPSAAPVLDVEDQHNYQRFRLVGRALARRCLVDNDRAALHRLLARLRTWMSARDRYMERSMEPMNISLRLREWLWILLLLWNRIPHSTRDVVVDSMRRQKARLNRHVEYEVPGNHPIVNLFAIWMIEAFLDGGARSRRSRLTGRRLEAEALASFLPDHFHVELSTHYHVQMVRLLTEYVWLSRMIGHTVAPEFRDRLREWSVVLSEIILPDGRFPFIGDHCYSFFEDTPAADAFTVMALWGHGPDTESSFWLKRLTGFSSHVYASNSFDRRGLVHLFEGAGYLLARDGVSRAPSVCWFDLGSLGFARNPGHGHSDCLSVLLYLHGVPFLVDPGVNRYDDRPDALWFKTTSAHNTVSFRRHEVTRPWRFFRWTAIPPAPRRSFAESPTGFLARGTFDGYMATASAEVTRTCDLQWNAALIVTDDVRFFGETRDSLRVTWHLDPDWTVSRKSSDTIVASNGNVRVLVRIHGQSPVQIEIRQEPVARDYGSIVPGPVLVATLDQPAAHGRIVSTFDWSFDRSVTS